MSYVGVSFQIQQEHRAILGQWAQEEDRSISSILRRLVEQEIERRQSQPAIQLVAQPPTQTLNYTRKAH
jgi:hypothetical protein